MTSRKDDLISKIKIKWGHIEKKVIYSVILLFLALELLATFIKPAGDILTSTSNLFIAFILLFMYKLLNEIEIKNSNQSILLENSLSDAIDRAVQTDKNITSIDIFCHSAQFYCPLTIGILNQSNAPKPNIRVLLRNPNTINIDSHDTPIQKNEKKALKQEIELSKVRFNQLKKGQDFVHYYPFAPQFHFMIINNTTAVMGIYKSKVSSCELAADSSFIISSKFEEGEKIINEFKNLFDLLYNN
jgi:hypothetical protein